MNITCPKCLSLIPEESDICPVCDLDQRSLVAVVYDIRGDARRRVARWVDRTLAVAPVVGTVLLVKVVLGLGWLGWHTVHTWEVEGSRLRVGPHVDAGAGSRGQTYELGLPGPDDLDPSAVVVLTNGGLLVGDTRHGVVWLANEGHRSITLYGHHVRPGTAVVVAGGGGEEQPAKGPRATGDGGPATQAVIDGPASLTVDAHDNLYIADRGSQSIREVDATTGRIITIISN